MKTPTSPKPKQILLSKRANVFYLEHVRIMQKDERIVYLTAQGGEVSQFFNIPERNTSTLLLGKGSSITDSAARRLAESNVIVGFCGSGGTPLFSMIDVAFLVPQSEYRPTEYMQGWAEKWFNEPVRIAMAKSLVASRIDLCMEAWQKNPWLLQRRIALPEAVDRQFRHRLQDAGTSQDILLAEAEWAKRLYAILAAGAGLEFTRDPGQQAKTSTADRVNGFLDHGNYLAYGLAAVALNGLGISFSFPLLHGKTRRGALVFDVADLIKDAYVMPCAFECGLDRKVSDTDFRARLIEELHKAEALDRMFDVIKDLAAAPLETFV